MFSPEAVILTVIGYMLLLFGVAQLVEKGILSKRGIYKSPSVYALSIAVFFSSWTFYGSVGYATKNGLLFIGIYLGAFLGILLWWFVLRRMVAVKESFRITSIADFISTRYRRSQRIAAIVTVIALIGLLPYIALQLKAINRSFELITSTAHTASYPAGLVIAAFMVAFTIIFGVRRLDPTERHQGVMVALMIESLVKLVALLAVGLFVCFYLYDGFADLSQQITAAKLDHMLSMDPSSQGYSMWLTFIVLGFAAIYLLPRQFHVSVIENADTKHIKTAMWLFPLYMVGINLFVIPIAAAGLMQGLPSNSADFFALLLPQSANQNTLTLLAFLGGFSAATGMIIITTMTLSTMVLNHLILPIIEQAPGAGVLKTKLLQIKWLIVAAIISGSYSFEAEFSESYILVAIGLLSMVAILQFAPSVFIGMLWHKGNSSGAIAGLLAGFAIWCYTLALPAFIKQGWLSDDILLTGPWGVHWLKPESLFGLDGFNPITHSVIWSMVINIGLYVIGSLLFKPNKLEIKLTSEFFSATKASNLQQKARPTGLDSYIALKVKLEEAQTLLTQYMPAEKAKAAVLTIADDLQVMGNSYITIVELMEFHRMIEHMLAGSIGAASAHSAMEQNIRYTERETRDLKALFSHISELGTQVSPNNDASTTAEAASNGLGMLADLQYQIEQLEGIVESQRNKIAVLEEKLDARYQEIFKYRISEQKVNEENTQLRKQLVQYEKIDN